MSKSKTLGYGYLYHYNEYTKLWECAHRDNVSYLFGTGYVNRDKYIATGKTPDLAASSYLKKFKP